MTASDTFVKDLSPRDQYTASANQTTFDYNFLIFDSDDLTVLETTDPDTASEQTTTLSEGTDYSVSGVGDEDGGSITLNSGADSGDIYTLQRESDIERLTDFLQSGEFEADNINQELDTLFLILLEQRLQSKRAVTLKDESELSDVELPSAEADRAIAYNSNADGLTTIKFKDGKVSSYTDDEELVFGDDIDYTLKYDSNNDVFELFDKDNVNKILTWDKSQNTKTYGDIEDDQSNTIWDYNNQTLGNAVVDSGAIQTDAVDSNEIKTDAVTTTEASFTDQQLSTTDSPTFDDANINGIDYSVSVQGYLQPDGLTIANNSSDSDHDIDVTGGIVGVHDFNGNWRLVNAPDETPALQIDATGEGGRLSASALSANTWYEPAIIYDSTNDTVGYIMYKDADRPTAEGDLPGSFDHFRAMGTPGKTWWVKTDGSSNILGFRNSSDGNTQFKENALTGFNDLLNKSTFGSGDESASSLDLSAQIPPTMVNITISEFLIESNSNGALLGLIGNSTNTTQTENKIAWEVGTSQRSGFGGKVPGIANQELFWLISASGRANQIIIRNISNFKAVN